MTKEDFTLGMKSERMTDLALAFKQTGTILAAIEMDLFTHIANGAGTVDEIAAAMGIDGYTRWLQEAYPKCFVAAPPSKPRPFDHVYLDLIGHFHYFAYQGAKNEEHLTKLVYKDVDRILKLLQPRKSVVLMMDGPAPRAKLLTQRARCAVAV